MKIEFILTALGLLAACGPTPVERRVQDAEHLGSSYLDGTREIGLLVEMLRDDAPSVRAAAARSLAALGRRGLRDLSEYLLTADEVQEAGLATAASRLALLAILIDASDISQGIGRTSGTAVREAGAASAVLTVWAAKVPGAWAWTAAGPDVLIDVLCRTADDADKRVAKIAAASAAVLGWAQVAERYPAAPNETDALTPLLSDPTFGSTWAGFIASCLIVSLRPDGPWPSVVSEYPCGLVSAAEASLLRRPLASVLTELHTFVGPESEPVLAGDTREEHLIPVLRHVSWHGTAAIDAQDDLMRLLASERGLVRVEVAKALLTISTGDRETIARSVGAVLRGSDVKARLEALRVLTELGRDARSARADLLRVLQWDEPRNASQDDLAARELAQRDLAEQCTRLGERFMFEVRSKRTVARILGDFGDAELVPALQRLAGHPDRRLRYCAQNSIRSIRKSAR